MLTCLPRLCVGVAVLSAAVPAPRSTRVDQTRFPQRKDTLLSITYEDYCVNPCCAFHYDSSTTNAHPFDG